MTPRCARRLLWALPLLPLAAQPAQAMSITCYGSIVITSLGTDGVKIEANGPVTVTPGLGEPAPNIGTPGGSVGELPPPTTSHGEPPAPPTTTNSTATPLPPGTGAQGNPEPTSGPTPPVEETPPPPPGAGPDNPPLPTEPPTPAPEVPPTEEPAPPPGVPPVPTSGGVANTPEPASLTLLGLAGLGALGYARKRRGR